MLNTHAGGEESAVLLDALQLWYKQTLLRSPSCLESTHKDITVLTRLKDAERRTDTPLLDYQMLKVLAITFLKRIECADRHTSQAQSRAYYLALYEMTRLLSSYPALYSESSVQQLVDSIGVPLDPRKNFVRYEFQHLRVA